MIIPKLYLYDSTKSDYKGTDYSQYVLSGVQYTEDLTEVLDTCELTLAGVSFSEEFAPTTKFILEIWEDGALSKYYHLIVSNDVVSQPILSDDNYFNHSISFIEPSAIAQGRVVDNMAVTYKLKNVSIDKASTVDLSTLAEAQKIEPIKTPEANNGNETTGNFFKLNYYRRYTRKFEFDFTHSGGSLSDWNANKLNIINDSNNPSIVWLPIPMIKTYFGAKNSTAYETHANYCSTRLYVYYKDFGSETWVRDDNLSRRIDPNRSFSDEANWQSSWAFTETTPSVEGYDVSRTTIVFGLNGSQGANWVDRYKKFAVFDSNTPNRSLNLTLSSNRTYKIIVTLANFDTPTNALGDHGPLFIGDGAVMPAVLSYSNYTQVNTIIFGTTYTRGDGNAVEYAEIGDASNDGNPCLSLTFNVYEKSSTQSYQFQAAPPVSAYDLFVDAQLKSQTTRKETGVFYRNTELPYYCEPNDVKMLQYTPVIESIYNEKNLWEIFLEIGKYIHSIPYIEFGENDRFLVKWKKLGDTTQVKDYATTMSIFNNRSIENYVSALSSYVNNMVQLGGQIKEITCAKSESEDELVYNDVATINVSKPIIQIDELWVKCIRANSHYNSISVGDTRNITNYIYEKHVYDLLDITETIVPNKGMAIYYNLGENVIRGLNYQLPSVNTGDAQTDYAFKRILGTAFGITSSWTYFRINDFVFEVKYRTKENTRSEQSRPDLRKYLINSAYEVLPYHKQFNNQQDKVVDSVKFGNQTYGKLIKTGNTELQATEWNLSTAFIKNAGTLINERGNLYYVSKATHTFFQDHVDSEIVFSKDYNQLSEIIGIPSEPRFFEISEQSQVDREVVIDDRLLLGTKGGSNTYFGLEEIVKLLLGNATYPKYALTFFHNDDNNPDPKSILQTEVAQPISCYSMRNTLSMKWAMQDNMKVGEYVLDDASNNTWYLDISNPSDNTAYAKLVPVQYVDTYGRADLVDFHIINDLPNSELNYASYKNLPISPIRVVYPYLSEYQDEAVSYEENGNAIVIHPNTDDLIVATQYYDTNGTLKYLHDGSYLVDDGAYIGLYEWNSLTDRFRRMYLYSSGTMKETILEQLKKHSIGWYVDYGYLDIFVDDLDIILAKDCRERIEMNYNLQMLTDSDRFVLSGYLWQQEKGTLKLALLNEEVNKIVNDTIPTSTIIGFDPNDTNFNYLYNFTYDVVTEGEGKKIKIHDALNGVDLNDVKSIAIVSTSIPDEFGGSQMYFVAARNVDNLADTEAEKDHDWFLTAVDDDFFKRQ